MSTSFPPSTSTARYSALDHGSPGDLVLNGAPDTDQDPDPDPDESDFEAKGLLASDARSRRGSSATQNHSDIDEIGLTVGKGKGGKKSAGWSSWGTASSAMSDLERKAFVREMTVETFPILILSLVGSVFTGMLLEKLQQWRVFIRVEELFILVPILLNLKGNLEMNLAARFSTSANIGELDLRLTRRSLVYGNMALLQVQALIVSLISGLLSFSLGVLSRQGFHHALQHPIYHDDLPEADELRGGYFEALMLLCVSMLAASASSLILGSFMCALVIVCRRFKINPDNIATPLASSLGDLVTLVILGVLSSMFAAFMGTFISTVVFGLLLAAVVVNTIITFRNAYVQELLAVGWGPLFTAMAISSGSGLVLEAYVNEFAGFALFAPVVTAITGNAGSIFVSRISTALHSSQKEHYLIVSSALFGVTTPVLVLFLGFVWITGQAPVSWAFAGCFLVVVCIQCIVALALGYYLCILLWRLDYDPDVYALPLLSSFLDVTGQLMLVAAFSIARRVAGGTGGGVEELGEVGKDVVEKLSKL